MLIAEARHVSKRFGARRALSDASLEIRTGDRVVLLGGNGSGKSTLLQIIAGVLAPDSGQVVVEAEVGYAPEKPDAPDHLLVDEWLSLIASLKGVPVEHADDLGVPSLYGSRLASLSLGQRQRVSLAAACMGAPALLVLDEPTNALDSEAREAIVQRLATATAIIATHDEEFAEQIATCVWRVEGGSLRRASVGSA